MTRINLRQLSGLTALVATLVGSAAAEDSLEAIRAALAKTESMIGRLECSYLSLAEADFRNVELPFVRKRRDSATWSVTMFGEGTVRSEGVYTDDYGDGVAVTLEEARESSFESGIQTTSLTTGGKTAPTAKDPRTHLVVPFASPLSMSVGFRQRPLSSFVSPDCVIVGREEWESRPVVAVDMTPAKERPSRQMVFWIDVERGVAVRRLVFSVSEGEPALVSRAEAREFAKVAPGVWLPSSYGYVGYATYENGDRYICEKKNVRVTEWKVTSPE